MTCFRSILRKQNDRDDEGKPFCSLVHCLALFPLQWPRSLQLLRRSTSSDFLHLDPLLLDLPSVLLVAHQSSRSRYKYLQFLHSQWKLTVASLNFAFASITYCFPISLKVDSTIECEPCNGKGWIVCDFCEGQKTNVKAENNRIYRRCPSCRAVSELLVSAFISMLKWLFNVMPLH